MRKRSLPPFFMQPQMGGDEGFAVVWSNSLIRLRRLDGAGGFREARPVRDTGRSSWTRHAQALR